MRTDSTATFRLTRCVALATGFLFLAILTPMAATANTDRTCSTIEHGSSKLGAKSPIIDQSGLKIEDALRVVGILFPQVKSLEHLQGWCDLGFTSSRINIRFWALGTDNKLYNLRETFNQAEQVNAMLASKSALPPATTTKVAPASAVDPWDEVIKPEYEALTNGSMPCSVADASCGNFYTALQQAEASGESALPSTLPTFQVVTYYNFTGQRQTQPVFGAAFGPSSAPASTGGFRSLSYNDQLTIYLNGRAYTAVDLSQMLDLNPAASTFYTINAKVGPDMPTLAGYQLLNARYATKNLQFEGTNSEGKDFVFCELAPIPIFGHVGFSITAELGCKGDAAIDYSIDATPMVGYARLSPQFNVMLYGDLKVNATIVVGTAEADVTLASLTGSGGIIYGTFNYKDPGTQQTAHYLAFRQFEYYDAQAISVDIKVSVQFAWGASLPPKTIHLWTLAQNSQPLTGDWLVVKV